MISRIDANRTCILGTMASQAAFRASRRLLHALQIIRNPRVPSSPDRPFQLIVCGQNLPNCQQTSTLLDNRITRGRQVETVREKKRRKGEVRRTLVRSVPGLSSRIRLPFLIKILLRRLLDRVEHPFLDGEVRMCQYAYHAFH